MDSFKGSFVALKHNRPYSVRVIVTVEPPKGYISSEPMYMEKESYNNRANQSDEIDFLSIRKRILLEVSGEAGTAALRIKNPQFPCEMKFKKPRR